MDDGQRQTVVEAVIDVMLCLFLGGTVFFEYFLVKKGSLTDHGNSSKKLCFHGIAL
jgi:hypothetical protein